MKSALVLTICLALPLAAPAKTDAELREEMQLKVAEEFGKCAGYFEIAASVLRELKNPGVKSAKRDKKTALAQSVAMATPYKGKRDARKFADQNLGKAINDMNAVAKTDPVAFNELLETTRLNCRNAIDDRGTFIDTVLADYRKPKPAVFNSSVFGTLSAESILKNARPATPSDKPRACSEPDEEVRIPLNDVLAENGKFCSAQDKRVCDSEQLWQSPKEIVEDLHPGRRVLRHSQNLSVTFKNGQSIQKRELVACLAGAQ